MRFVRKIGAHAATVKAKASAKVRARRLITVLLRNPVILPAIVSVRSFLILAPARANPQLPSRRVEKSEGSPHTLRMKVRVQKTGGIWHGVPRRASRDDERELTNRRDGEAESGRTRG